MIISLRNAVLFIVTAGAVAALTAQAAQDNFTGYTTSTFSQNGGTTTGNISWTSAWGEGGFGQSAAIIQSNIGTVNGFASATPYAEYTLNGSFSLETIRSFSLQSNEVIYLYGLISAGKSGGFSTTNSFGGIELYEGGTEKFLIGEQFQQSTWGVTSVNQQTNQSFNSTVPIGNFNTALLVLKLDQVNNTMTFWVNPDFSLTEGANIPAFFGNYGGTGDDDVDTLRLRAGTVGTGDVWQFDNINVTQDSPFQPVPEPSTWIAAGLGVATCLWLRFRRRLAPAKARCPRR